MRTAQSRIVFLASLGGALEFYDFVIFGIFATDIGDAIFPNPTRVRFSGVALGFNVAFTFFSGTAPLVATSLIRGTGLSTAPALLMVACGLLTMVGSLGLSKAGGHVLKARSGYGANTTGQ